MNGPVATRGDVRKRIREVSSWVTAALLGTGLGLSLTIILLAPGVAIFLLGGVAAALGWLASVLVPLFVPARSLACPHCGTANDVLRGVKAFRCDDCSREAPVEQASPVAAPRLVAEGEWPFARRVLIYLTCLAFLGFFVEAYLGHADILATRTFSGVWVPIIFSPIAFIISLVTGMVLIPATVRVFAATMWLSLAVGIAGFFFHLTARSFADFSSLSAWLSGPPILGPFSFIIAGLLGLVAIYQIIWAREGAWKEEEKGLAPQQPVVVGRR
ncbi:MAG: hypothetical protein HYX89_06510 [Chloroflexi bacterium]|nr:hypothetical protein [Chloroflexota bacterium]